MCRVACWNSAPTRNHRITMRTFEKEKNCNSVLRLWQAISPRWQAAQKILGYDNVYNLGGFKDWTRSG